jgi:3'-5' exoribonuclease
MSRRFISQLGERETVDQIFLASEKQLRANRNGNLYLQVRLADRTGSVTAMLWNANDTIYGSFENGDYLRVQGTTQFYNGALQLIVNRVDKADSRTIDEVDFCTLGATEIDRLATRLCEMLRGVRNYHLRNLAECFLMDESFMARFTRAPAGVKNHHAYHGGLMQHVLSLMELTAVVAPRYPDLDAELLLLGAFLHDLGKIDELTYERDLGYSDEGQLIGHVVLGVALLEEKVREAEKLSGEQFPRELRLRLKHMLVSHHGEYQYGSPKLPMTTEAIALHLLDNLDAKIHSLGQIIREDANADSNWTPYQANLGRKLFKGGCASPESENKALDAIPSLQR